MMVNHAVKASHQLRSMRAVLGFTIIELMVSLTIGLIILAGMTALFAGPIARTGTSNAAQQIENGSYAISALAEDLRHAGYYGGAYLIQAAPPAALPDPCMTNNAAALTAALAFPVQGYDAPGAAPVGCIPAADFVPGTDVIVVRRASTTVTALASLDASDMYIQNNNDWTSASNPTVGLGLAANFPLLKKDGLSPADVRKYYVRIYYIGACNLYAPGASTCTPAADGGVPIPTLKMLELGLDPGGAHCQCSTSRWLKEWRICRSTMASTRMATAWPTRSSPARRLSLTGPM
jgi:type IV pilus assembly protein PilW